MIIRNHYYQNAVFTNKISERFDQKNNKLLDVGAGSSPSRKYFTKIKYLTQDITQNKENSIDYICDINEGIPQIKNSSIDVILSTQVLEHIKEPHKVYKEFNRILKKGGRLYLTTNMAYEEHMVPYDYFRYTRYGLEYLGVSNGLKVISIKPQGGYFQVLYYMIVNLPIFIFIKRESVLYYLYFVIFSIPIFLLGLVFYFFDYLDKKRNITINYQCIYRK